MKLLPEQFKPKETWAVARMNAFVFVQEKPVDVYVLIDAGSLHAYGHILVPGEVPSVDDVKDVFRRANQSAGRWPNKVFLPKGDPAEGIFSAVAKPLGFPIEVVPSSNLDTLFSDLRGGFANFMGRDRSGSLRAPAGHDSDEVKAFIPDSYDPCWCASGKKFKFCCKPILHEIVEAMCAFEDRNLPEAFRWLDAAREKVGDTGEILCRYAILYSSESDQKFISAIEKTLDVAPNHPRAHYLMGLHYVKHRELNKAEVEYLTAIKNYPAGDRFHLNETWNNLATVYFNLGEPQKAKDAWEKAVMYLPSDKLSKSNLTEFIYENLDLSQELRTPSPFIARFL